ncbi:WD40 repeat-like protein [Anaeromyces robustus]|uniref:ASTRA-associated protein 1 n=1 Tax=Anaeromyces robustus TaxID=1754192 RepID=A0A1Y1WWM9_9FUNG|nr:WD40 repeat-like protein [Anaeromyces robustus]|eukprot:ORX77616.1 WD40 repeat-like protein [Anaeromyces robustus]
MSKLPPDPIYIFRGHNSVINTVKILKDIVISGDINGQIILWDLKSKKQILKWKAHNDAVLSIDYIYGKEHIISQGRDNLLLAWDYGTFKRENAKEIKIISSLVVDSLSFCKFNLFQNEDSSELLLAIPKLNKNEFVDIIDLNSKTVKFDSIGVQDKDIKAGMCMCMKLIKKDCKLYLLVGYEYGNVIMWNLENKDICWNLKFHSEPVFAIDVSNSLKYGISVSADNIIAHFEITENKNPKYKEIKSKTCGFADIKFRYDDKIFATAGWDSKIRIFHAKKLIPLAILSYHRGGIQELDFLKKENENDGKINELISCSKDGCLSLWKIY